VEEFLSLFCFFGQKRADCKAEPYIVAGRRVEPYKVVGCGVKPRRKVQGAEPLIRGSRAEPYKNVPVFTGNIISFKNKKINPLYSYNGSLSDFI
ncbi:hypothetical protein, partial [Anaerofustis stercorihominis]|uniref:hypothetical protein n=1 Tax=Anaerofustis stercorihominis TaxID=214853 RepID=UPI00214B68AA